MAGISTLASILSQLEGNGTTDINGRANNPLNVEIGDIGYGTIPAAGGNQITVFPDPQSGLSAGISHLQSALASVGSPGPYQNVQTFGQFLSVWAGNPSSSYVSTAAAAVGLSASTPISQAQAALGAFGGVQGADILSLTITGSGRPTIAAPQAGAGDAVSLLTDSSGAWVGLALLAGAGVLLAWLFG